MGVHPHSHTPLGVTFWRSTGTARPWRPAAPAACDHGAPIAGGVRSVTPDLRRPSRSPAEPDSGAVRCEPVPAATCGPFTRRWWPA